MKRCCTLPEVCFKWNVVLSLIKQRSDWLSAYDAPVLLSCRLQQSSNEHLDCQGGQSSPRQRSELPVRQTEMGRQSFRLIPGRNESSSLSWIYYIIALPSDWQDIYFSMIQWIVARLLSTEQRSSDWWQNVVHSGQLKNRFWKKVCSYFYIACQ